MKNVYLIIAIAALSAPSIAQAQNSVAPELIIVSSGQAAASAAPEEANRCARPASLIRYLSCVRIGATAADPVRELQLTALEKFATLKFENDYLTDTQTGSVDLMGVFPRLFDGRTFGWRRGFYPILAYQRSYREAAGVITKDLEDLTFGGSASLTRSFGSWTVYVTPALAWETDTEFDSSVYIASASVRPIWNGDPHCINSRATRAQRFACSLRLVIDHQEVDDPGEKAALQTASSFTRAGFDIGASYNISPNEDWGDIVLGVRYSRRETFDDEVGDADHLAIELSVSPTENSPFKIGLTFEHGEDLTSLEPERSLSLTFGFRN